MNFESFIAKRYLLSKHKINFISIISIISIIGITIGVAALIIVLSVFNGFGSLVTGYLMNLDPHIRIEARSQEGLNEIDRVRELLSASNQVDSFAPFVDSKVLAFNKGITQVVNLKGITETSAGSVYNIEPAMDLGELNIEESDNVLNAIIGLLLADKLQVITGDTLTLISPVGIERVIAQFSLPLTKKIIIRGIFNSNNNDYDAGYIFTNLKNAQEFLGYRNEYQGYEARLNSINYAFAVQRDLQIELNENDYSINTWYDFHKELYSVMQIERWTAYIILSLIIAVASFNILGSLSMSVIEKKRDIGILRSMGVKENSILKIFMFEGLLIGMIGTLLGIIIGYFVCYLQINFNIYPLDPTQYKINSLPIELRLSDFFFISGAAMLLSFLASLYPAKRAAKVDAIQAIKWE